MKLRFWARILAAFLMILPLFGITTSVVNAHELGSVGKYNLEVGFFVEPAIEGQMNGVDLRVTDNSTQQPVTGLETTLQVEITSVTANASQVFSIQPVDADSDPGHYNNGFIPTMPGQYKFRVFGNIQGTPINETFTSGPDTFSDVLEATSVDFPLKLASPRELDSVTRTTQAAAIKAQSTAQTANTLAVIGIVLGAAGAGLGAWAFVAARKK